MNPRICTSFSKTQSERLSIIDIYIAILNFIWAKQNNGRFYINIEDISQSELLGSAEIQLLKNLEWFGITSTYTPNYQSNKQDIYKDKLETLITGNKVYRCFCPDSSQEKEYNRSCLGLSSERIKAKLAAQQKFVWKLKIETPILPQNQTYDAIKLEFKPLTFKDFALTTQDGSYTQVFMNFVDDWQTHVTHKFIPYQKLHQAEQQIVLNNTFIINKPNFYIAPQIITPAGTTISRTDFGFYVQDLRNIGLTPLDILNKLLGMNSENIVTLIKNFSFKQLTKDKRISIDWPKK